MRKLTVAEIDSVLEQKMSWIVRACTAAEIRPSAVVAFGSAARNELREDSDIDLAVLFPDENSLRIGRRAVHTAAREDLWPLDMLFYTQREFRSRAEIGGVCMVIREEGRLLYGTLAPKREGNNPGYESEKPGT